MKLIAKYSGFILLFSSAIALATPLSPVIPLNGGALKPRPGYLDISLDELPTAVHYNVTCTVTSNNKSGQTEDIISVFRASGYQIDNNPFVAFKNIPIPTNQSHTLRIFDVPNGVWDINPNLSFSNLDDTDTITFSNCYALPA